MKRTKALVLVAFVGILLVAATSRFADTVQLFDQVALMFGGADRTETGDFYVSYDEATDNRLEVTDGTNLLMHYTDAGTTGNLNLNGGDLTADDITVGDITASGAVSIPADDLLGTANQITVTDGADTILGGNATLTVPSTFIAPGSIASTTTLAAGTSATVGTTLGVTGNTTLTGDLAVNGDDITSDGRLILTGTSGVRVGGAAATFDVKYDDNATTTTLYGYVNSGSVKTTLSRYAYRGTTATPVLPSAGDILHRDRYYSHDGSNLQEIGRFQWEMASTGSVSAGTSMPGELTIYVTPTGTVTPEIALTIDQDKSMTGTGNWATSGDMAVNGDDITADGNLTINSNSGTGTITLNNDISVTDDATIGDDIILTDRITGTTGNVDLNATAGILYESSVGMTLDVETDAGSAGGFNITDNGSTRFNMTNNGDFTFSGNGRLMPFVYNFGQAATPSEVTISGGVLTITNSAVLVGGEGDVSDTLVSITGGSIGDVIILRPVNNSETITVSNGATISCGSNFDMDNQYDTMILLKATSTLWIQLARNDNGA